MADHRAEPETPFWDFSLKLYARPGVAEACLALQERHGTDVNLLLFCCWAGSRGRGLSGAELAGLIAVVSEWQTEVVRPLRGIRRWLKGRERGLGERVEPLRAEIKARELDAERIEQELLEGALAIEPGDPSPAAAAANLQAYLAELKLGGNDDAVHIAARLGAAFRDLCGGRKRADQPRR